MTPTPVTGFRLPLHLLERIDSARGGESRTSWLIRAAEAQLDAGRQTFGGAPVVEDVRVPEGNALVCSPDPAVGVPVEFRDEVPAGAFSRLLASDAKAGVVPR